MNLDPIRAPPVERICCMPNVRAANKVKIGAWVDRMDAANLRQFAASQGLHVSTLIEAAVIKSLPMLFAQASHASQLTPPSQMGTSFILKTAKGDQMPEASPPFAGG